YANPLGDEGMERHAALVAASHVRLRPILMTTISIVAGMLPIAFGRGAGAGSRANMAVTIIGGQMLCLLLTLLVTPVVYSYFDDLRECSPSKIFALIRRRATPPGTAILYRTRKCTVGPVCDRPRFRHFGIPWAPLLGLTECKEKLLFMKLRNIVISILFVTTLCVAAMASSGWVEEFLHRYEPSKSSASGGTNSSSGLGQLLQTGEVPVTLADVINLMIDNNLDIRSNRLSPRSSYWQT